MLLVLVCDQATKAWAWNSLRDGPPFLALPGYLHFDFALNRGAAFGVGAGATGARFFFITLAIFMTALVFWSLRRFAAESRLAAFAGGLAAGGATGNMLDRLWRVTDLRHVNFEGVRFEQFIEHGPVFAKAAAFGRRYVDLPEYGVVDFIVVLIGDRTWPAFNVADVALSCSIALLAFWSLRPERDEPSQTAVKDA